jgi:glycosyltransferase involved in cell wall biosynthesis
VTTPDLANIAPGSSYASLISLDPPIVVGWTGRLYRFGGASVLAPLFRSRRLVFLLFAKGSLADEAEAEELARDALPFMAAHPHHRFEWICNIEEETQRLRGLGLSAHTHNQNMFLREDVFRPLWFVRRRYDAIYNGRISPEKRNELAARIPRVAFIAYRDPGEHSVAAFHAACAELAGRVPGGRLLNRLTETGCARLTPVEVNRAYAAAGVGLCLSPREGAMRVAVEYQLAGLPIVATPCRGGRDHYLDSETWLVVPPDEAAVRDATATLLARRMPRRIVRDRVLKRMAAARIRFADFVEGIVAEEGGVTSFRDRFAQMLAADGFERWVVMRDFAAETWAALGGD